MPSKEYLNKLKLDLEYQYGSYKISDLINNYKISKPKSIICTNKKCNYIKTIIDNFENVLEERVIGMYCKQCDTISMQCYQCDLQTKYLGNDGHYHNGIYYTKISPNYNYRDMDVMNDIMTKTNVTIFNYKNKNHNIYLPLGDKLNIFPDEKYENCKIAITNYSGYLNKYCIKYTEFKKGFGPNSGFNNYWRCDNCTCIYVISDI